MSFVLWKSGRVQQVVAYEDHQSLGVNNAIDEALLTATPVEYFYRNLQLAGPLTDCCTTTYQGIVSRTLALRYACYFHQFFLVNFSLPFHNWLRLFLRMQNGSYGLRGDLKPSFLHSFTRSDVNKRPLTDGWQTYM